MTSDCGALLAQVADLIAERMGLYFPAERTRDLARSIASVAGELEAEDLTSCLQVLLAERLSGRQLEILTGALTVGETYFFRDPPAFYALETRILPELIRSRQGARRLRIWSAGCATGEEPYSIAMVLKETIPAWEQWDISIFATDLNHTFLRKAKEGLYGKWSFRGDQRGLRARHFTGVGNERWQILPELKEKVVFSTLNLAEDAFPFFSSPALNQTTGVDVIFCRNVLMYFSLEQARKTATKLFRCLADDGWLIVGPAEASATLLEPFATQVQNGAVLCQKKRKGTAAAGMEHSEPTAAVKDAAVAGGHASIAVSPRRRRTASLKSGPGAKPPAAKDSVGSTASPEKSYDEALRLYRAGDYDRAGERLMQIMAAAPGCSDAMLLMARTLANEGKLAEAIDWCDRAIRIDRLSAATHCLRAVILEELGNTAEAAVALKRVLYLDPNLSVAHFLLGNLDRKQGKLRESDKHFRNALALLAAQPPEAPVSGFDDITAGRLVESIRATLAEKDIR